MNNDTNVVDSNNINLDINAEKEKEKEKEKEIRDAKPVEEDEYTILFNGLTKDKEDKVLSNEEFLTAVKDKFGDNVNANSSSTSNNINLETFKKQMENFEKLAKEPAAETNVAADPNVAADTNVAAAPNTNVVAAAAADTVYAIIQIDAAQKITVLDAIPDGQTLNTAVSPYDLLANKTESVFAVKIVKKDNCSGANDQIKCISFDNSHYELDLTTAVAAVGKLLEQDFLNASTGSANSVASTVSGNPGATIVSANSGATNVSDKKASSTGTEITGNDGSKLPGGSRKNRGQQSKKTKRKYYVYRK